ncbi:aerobic-type carbon monoxide dehydrogenase small subunit CoxS/CutS-like protein [Paramagnetospirillum caucaseum]|uniref:Aerobic-type carbon monoxide dehydrogenase small subunit CoxS/CutS-like protein n=1 Tax=Paramagnetospirillum caucaseum TaxID=1244869 RepID=M2Y996_9PROT|nr:(2Fe-2S)-binding protein [Paramagnetospirillum caucaseum]EME69591.1 aerobic-type carbon monoxide dehydrogenase small subunit CoxS/CutS-like protein [Paramagnetospirillum caucaseum]
MPGKPASPGKTKAPALLFLTVNGAERNAAIADGDMPLIYWLRGELELTGTHLGCGKGECGACTVLIDGQPARACQIPVAAAAGRSVTTIEGLGTPLAPHPLQAAFIAEQAAQCGWCTPGMVMEGAALLARDAQPGRDEVKAALDGHLCRCGSHHRVLRAVLRAAGGAKP